MSVTTTVETALPPFFYTQIYLTDVIVGLLFISGIIYLILRKSNFRHLKYAIPFSVFAFGFAFVSAYLSPYVTFNPVYTSPNNVTYVLTPYSTSGSTMFYIAMAVVGMAMIYLIYAVLYDLLKWIGGSEGDYYIG